MSNLKSQSGQNPLLLAVGGVLCLGGVGLVLGYFMTVNSASAGQSMPAKVAPEAPAETTDAADPQVEAKVREFLAGKVTLTFGDKSLEVPWGDLGAELDRETVSAASLAGGEFEGLVPVRLDRVKATAYLTALKPKVDISAQDARMDLEARTITKEEPGNGLDVFSAVSEIEATARRGKATATLPGAPIPPSVTVQDLGIDDVSHRLAKFRTKFSLGEKSRSDNLKLVASHIHGHVLQPGEEFSFNEVVGRREEKDGYKTAHVILKGEMVDGMAGGACQISTTLHGAAFFAGLDIVQSTPHSRPSTYVAMGLDATVVYPTVDLKIKNPYDFPVAISYRVSSGEAYVEILGKERPYDKIEFVRDIRERLQFETITREDEEIAIGHMVVDQPGYPGYRLDRYRNFYKDGKVVKKDKWRLGYRPVVEYVRMGVSPNPNLAPPKAKKPHGPKKASGKFKMSQ